MSVDCDTKESKRTNSKESNQMYIVQGAPEDGITQSRPPRLSLENIAVLYNQMGNDDGLLNSTRCLAAIIRFLTSHRMRKIASWSKLFDPAGIRETGWNKTLLTYFGSQKHVDGWFQWYKRKKFERNRQVIRDTDKKTILNKIMEHRTAWFLDHKFAPITAAFVVKVYEASKRCKNQMLPPAIYKKAKPVFLGNWKFWCQRLVLDSGKFNHICPFALEKGIAYDNAEIYTTCFNDRNRYLLDDEALSNNAELTKRELTQSQLNDLALVALKSDTENVATNDAVKKYFSTSSQVQTPEDDISISAYSIEVSNQVSCSSNCNTNNTAEVPVIEQLQNKFQGIPYAELEGASSVLNPTEYVGALEQDFTALNQEHVKCELKIEGYIHAVETQNKQLTRLLRMKNKQRLTSKRFSYLATLLNNKSLASSMLLHFRQLLFTHAQNASSIDIVSEIQNMISGKQIVLTV